VIFVRTKQKGELLALCFFHNTNRAYTNHHVRSLRFKPHQPHQLTLNLKPLRNKVSCSCYS
jgi:hypothetical protein